MKYEHIVSTNSNLITHLTQKPPIVRPLVKAGLLSSLFKFFEKLVHCRYSSHFFYLCYGSMTSLQTYFRAIPDIRRKQGIRYPLDAMLMITVLAMMSGRFKYREIERFAKNNKATLCELLGLNHGVPSNVSIREVLRTLNWKSLQEQFHAWILERLSVSSEAVSKAASAETILARIMAFDGKSIRATMENYADEQQNFVCFLHGFLAESGIIAVIQEYQNGHTSEQHVLQEVISTLKFKGYILTLDALHTQKKRSTAS
jgi:DDE_Tnp_1-associated